MKFPRYIDIGCPQVIAISLHNLDFILPSRQAAPRNTSNKVMIVVDLATRSSSRRVTLKMHSNTDGHRREVYDDRRVAMGEEY
jgi:hypothetical protein